MGYAFERFVFYGTASNDRRVIDNLQNLYPRISPRTIHFVNSANELEHLQSTDLLLCCGTTLASVHKIISEFGQIAAMRFETFVANATPILNLQASAVFGDVVLAFLPEALKRQSIRLFSLFGFNPIAVESSNALLKELKHGASIVVFDQDMPSLKGRVHESREKVFSLLRAERRAHRHLAVVIIKDLEQGSLFSDMSTMAKDVSNAMLEPQEFLEFMRNYLSDFLSCHATWRLRVGSNVGLAQASYAGRPSASLGLQDVKVAFHLSQDKVYHDFLHTREQLVQETQDLAARLLATEWLFDKQLAGEAQVHAKNLLVRSELPELFDREAISSFVLQPEPATKSEPQSSEVAF